MHVWDGECHVHAGIRPADIEATRAAHPGADFLIHPECGCTTSVMEYVAAGDVAAEGVHMLSTGGMLDYAREAARGAAAAEAIVATETGMLYPLQMAAPERRVHPRQRRGLCGFMKMITLPKLRDALRDDALRGPGAARRSPSRHGCRSTAWSRSAELGRREPGRWPHAPRCDRTACRTGWAGGASALDSRRGPDAGHGELAR